MTKQLQLDSALIQLINKLSGELPNGLFLCTESWAVELRKMFVDVVRLREDLDLEAKEKQDNSKYISSHDFHVGESDYSKNKIQPWDIWIEYALNPWDADICKRIIRTKIVPGMTAAESRIQDYEKIQHICQERINQINAGEPWYKQFKLPPWVEE